MKTNKPFFSVVLPTYNRVSYLPFAVKSALAQTFTDFELIISNNSSTDETEKVVREFDDRRIRYVKTPQNLHMNQHFEFALSQASGEYVTLLGDDDAHSSIYLEMLHETIAETSAKIAVCRIGHYYYQQLSGYGTTFPVNSFTAQHFTGDKTVVDSRKVIDSIYSNMGFPPEFPIPQLSNAAYHRTVFPEIKQRTKYLFPSTVFNDIYSAVTTTSMVDEIAVFDAPLFVHGFSKDSSSSVDSKEKKKAFRKMFPTDFADSDKLLELSGTSWLPTLIKAKEDLSPDLDYLTIDWSRYFIKSYEGILSEELSGFDTQEERAEFFSVLKKQDEELQKRMSTLR